MYFIITSFILMVFSFISKKKLFYVSFPFVALFFSMTFGYGYDWINYNDFYYDSIYTTTLPFEPGLFYLMKLFVSFDFPFKYLVFIIYLFIYYCCYSFCKKMNNPMIAFYCMFSLLGFYMFSEQFRQGIALGIILLGLSRTNKEYPWKILPYIIVASFFHVSALTALLYNLIFIDNERRLKLNVIFITLFIASLLIVLSSPGIISFIPYIGDKVSDYSSLLGNNRFSFLLYMLQQKQSYVFLALLIISIIIFKQQKSKKILWAVLSAYFLLLTKMAQFLVRFGYYFVPFIVMGLDNYFESKSKKGYLYAYKTIFLLIIFIMSTIPFFISSYMKISTSPATIFDSKSEIENKISIRCEMVQLTGVGDGVIKRCY